MRPPFVGAGHARSGGSGGIADDFAILNRPPCRLLPVPQHQAFAGFGAPKSRKRYETSRIQVRRRFFEQICQLRIGQFDDLTGIHVDQVIVVRRMHDLELRRLVAETVPLHYACIGQAIQHPIHGRNADPMEPDAGMDLAGAEMIGRFRQCLEDNAPLRAQPDAALDASPFERIRLSYFGDIVSRPLQAGQCHPSPIHDGVLVRRSSSGLATAALICS